MYSPIDGVVILDAATQCRGYPALRQPGATSTRRYVNPSGGGPDWSEAAPAAAWLASKSVS